MFIIKIKFLYTFCAIPLNWLNLNVYIPETFRLYSSGLCKYMAAASPFSGSIGLGYVNNCGRNDSKIFERSEKQNNISN